MVAVVVVVVVVAARVARSAVCVVLTGSHVPTDGLDVVAGEHASLAVAASFPPVGVRIIQDLDEFAALETELSFLLWVEVKESLHIRWVLRDLEEGTKKKEKKENRNQLSEHVDEIKQKQCKNASSNLPEYL